MFPDFPSPWVFIHSFIQCQKLLSLGTQTHIRHSPTLQELSASTSSNNSEIQVWRKPGGCSNTKDISKQSGRWGNPGQRFFPKELLPQLSTEGSRKGGEMRESGGKPGRKCSKQRAQRMQKPGSEVKEETLTCLLLTPPFQSHIQPRVGA